ncbi:MAG: hypothetical protein ABIJ40_00085 [Bacteroidota bacterium]
MTLKEIDGLKINRKGPNWRELMRLLKIHRTGHSGFISLGYYICSRNEETYINKLVVHPSHLQQKKGMNIKEAFSYMCAHQNVKCGTIIREFQTKQMSAELEQEYERDLIAEREREQ